MNKILHPGISTLVADAFWDMLHAGRSRVANATAYFSVVVTAREEAVQCHQIVSFRVKAGKIKWISFKSQECFYDISC